ncbi:MAG: NADH-quinone oxidoreductase subunit J [Prevotellaceae bacterium]|nr:NADH-quinone oxidoreductase subunit J [Prevotellaceae bacterium]MDY6130049.1 NADH-quinone oxidoreductase subunit J [Prevotella sp.]
MANIIVFAILAVVILGSAIMCVTTKRIMRSATFLLFVLLGIAGIYFLLDYTFLGVAQLSVYAGGVTMVYIFAIQLVNKRTLQGIVGRINGSRAFSGLLLSLVGCATVAVVFLKNQFINQFDRMEDAEVPMDVIGKAMVGADKYGYVLPFEFISVFLLACIIGGIVISRKE